MQNQFRRKLINDLTNYSSWGGVLNGCISSITEHRATKKLCLALKKILEELRDEIEQGKEDKLQELNGREPDKDIVWVLVERISFEDCAEVIMITRNKKKAQDKAYRLSNDSGKQIGLDYYEYNGLTKYWTLQKHKVLD